MKEIIVAGGRGERLRPITSSIPKPMVEVSGKPILEHIINLSKKHGISDFIIALCYLPEVITQYFGDGSKFGVNIEYTYENPENPLGTAGAISLARNLIDDTFIVTYADILRDLDISNMTDFHKQSGALSTINVYKRVSKDAKSMAIVNEENRVTQFIERPNESDLTDEYIWVNGSFYIFEPEIFDFIQNNTKLDFGADVFPKILAAGKKISTFPTESYFIDIGNLEKLESARRTFNKV